MLWAFLSDDDDDHWMLRRHDNAALLLSAESGVDVFTPVIKAVYFENRTHVSVPERQLRGREILQLVETVGHLTKFPQNGGISEILQAEVAGPLE
jgi:hypothetical protein